MAEGDDINGDDNEDVNDGNEARSSEPEDGSDDEVGYCKPPRHSRWPKGVSGNPSGRKKGSRGLKTDLNAELETKRTISLRGKEVKGTSQQLMLCSLAERAAVGDVRAARLLIDLTLQIFGAGDRSGDIKRLSAMDQALLELFLADASEDDDEPSEMQGEVSGAAAGGSPPLLAPPATPDDEEGQP